MSNTLHLCVTTRLAQTLRAGVPAGKTVWPTPVALTVGQWLSGLADEVLLSGIAELPTGLDPFAEKLLWEKLISASLGGTAQLFDIHGMAASAAEAHALSCLWEIRPPPAQLSDEAALFAGWQAEFEKYCRENGWLDQISLHQRLIGLIEAGHFALPEVVVFVGFDRLTPLEEALATALTRRGADVQNMPKIQVDRGIERADDTSSVDVVACPDSAAECAAVVAWAQAQMNVDPTARIAIVAPDLAGVRDRLEFLLDDALHPALIRPGLAEMPRAFNFSLGRALADLPLIRSALNLLALGNTRAKIEQGRLSALLLDDYWVAGVSEADGRARLDAAMRRNLPYFTSLPALIRLAGRLAENGTPLCPQSITALSAFVDTASAAGRKLRPAQWAGVFRACLGKLGWPGERALSSHEFQAHRAFIEVLAGFGFFDTLLGPLALGEAVHRLGQLCRERIFQPETRGRPPIQVLGILESAGLEFDALWVMGMNDDLWPSAPRPNPLLPSALLRAVGAAHASAEVELDFAQRVHARLLQAAPQVRFSWAQADGNRILRPSPLIAGLPTVKEIPVVPGGLAAQLASNSEGACELIDDAMAPPVGDGEKVSGGSWLLRAQAICPAWAYYQYRLGGEAMETVVEGLDPAARGTLVHEALEAFWTTVRCSQVLALLGEESRRRHIAEAVDKALNAFEMERRISLPARFRVLEADRLCKLLGVWLDVEAARGGEFEVIACEAPAEVEIEGIRVKMIVDRIDQLADGRQVIIDYKTGASIDTKNWSSQRITEPQLPIYAALVNDEVAAVVFAKVLLDKPAFAGVADEKEILPGVQGIGDDKQKIFNPVDFPDWIAVVTHWRERLHAVAREVKEGRAGVAFADEKTLQYCDVLPLLRLPERRRLLAARADKSGVPG